MTDVSTRPQEQKDAADEFLEATEADIRQILHDDHLKVDDLFFEYTQTDDKNRKQQIVEEITTELGVHAKAEEEIVYPVVRDGKEENEDMMDEADTEHHVVKFLLAELGNMKPSDSHYDSKVTVLSELVKHHVEEEEDDIFEKLEASGEDLAELGNKFLERKAELLKKPLPQEIFPVSGNKPADRKLA